jgi:hypothetical protein
MQNFNKFFMVIILSKPMIEFFGLGLSIGKYYFNQSAMPYPSLDK